MVVTDFILKDQDGSDPILLTAFGRCQICIVDFPASYMYHVFLPKYKAAGMILRQPHDLRREGLLETEQRYRPKGGKSSLLYKLKIE